VYDILARIHKVLEGNPEALTEAEHTYITAQLATILELFKVPEGDPDVEPWWRRIVK
jgi:hypothetical protein